MENEKSLTGFFKWLFHSIFGIKEKPKVKERPWHECDRWWHCYYNGIFYFIWLKHIIDETNSRIVYNVGYELPNNLSKSAGGYYSTEKEGIQQCIDASHEEAKKKIDFYLSWKEQVADTLKELK